MTKDVILFPNLIFICKTCSSVASVEQLAGEGDQRWQLVLFGHAGDGNLHVNFVPNQAASDSQRAALAGRVYEQVLRLEGSIAAEHGVGTIKRELLAKRGLYDSTGYTMATMKGIKQLLDPGGVLNPGKVL